MKRSFFLLLLLVIVGFLGYLAFPKSGGLLGLKDKQTNDTGSTVTESGTGAVKEEASMEESASTEVSEGLTLSVSSPLNRSTVSTETLQVIGKTSPNAEVYVNDQEGSADSTGNFFVNVILHEGENVLTVVVNDQSGNYAEKELTVYLESTE